MTYTTQQLQAMSDFEVNKAIMVKLGFKLSNWLNNNYGHYEIEGTTCLGNVKDYCNNTNDIMPLAFERNISLISSEAGINLNTWRACHGVVIQHGEIECELSYAAHSPLRAIACLILMMED